MCVRTCVRSSRVSARANDKRTNAHGHARFCVGINIPFVVFCVFCLLRVSPGRIGIITKVGEAAIESVGTENCGLSKRDFCTMYASSGSGKVLRMLVLTTRVRVYQV
ncbi:uncharacterized protein LOC143430317 [Xylocopa sonorina]|uniref:uncharacterized protein LOC143430317 n=1 Tax=Xylocopa sonorina TaxID=1818115 RepID=UPI00403AEF72